MWKTWPELLFMFLEAYKTACEQHWLYVRLNKVQFENHRSGGTLSSVYPSRLLLFSQKLLWVEQEWCMILKALLIRAAIWTYCICAKKTLLKEAEWQSIDGIQRESNTCNDGEQDQKTCAKWASCKPSFASSLLHSYSTALLSFFPHSLSPVQIHSIFIEQVCFSGGGFGVF